MQTLANLVLSAVALMLTAYLIPGIHLENFAWALGAALLIALANVLVKPLLILLTLPLTILSLGLFLFVINALVLLMCGSLVPGFAVEGLWAAILGSLALSFITSLLNYVF